MISTNFVERYASPEKIQEYVLKKFEEAAEHPERYHEFFIDDYIGYSAEKKDSLTRIRNAIIAVKYNTDIIYIRIADGKIQGTRPDEFYMVYRPEKVLAIGLRQDGKSTFIKIKEGEEHSLDLDITAFIIVQHEEGIFTLFYAPDDAMFTEPLIAGNDGELSILMKFIKRFFRLPSNFRSLPKETQEEDDYDE